MGLLPGLRSSPKIVVHNLLNVSKDLALELTESENGQWSREVEVDDGEPIKYEYLPTDL